MSLRYRSAITLLSIVIALAGCRGTPEKQENVDLAKKVSESKAPEPPAATASAPSKPGKSSTPEEIVAGYLAAASWVQRIPYVMNPAETQPKMAGEYQSAKPFEPENYKGLPMSSIPRPDGGTLVSVDVSKVEPEFGLYEYILYDTPDGPRIDWEASKALVEQRKTERIRSRFNLEQASLDVRIVKMEPMYSDGHATKVFVEFKNGSNATITWAAYNLTLEDSTGGFLSAEEPLSPSIPPGATVVGDRMFLNVPFANVAKAKLVLTKINVKNAAGESLEALQYFDVRVVQ